MKTKLMSPLNFIHAFEAAGKHESFREAATEQKISSGVINRQVRILESYLGTELFVRRTNWMKLASAGKEYARKMRTRRLF